MRERELDGVTVLEVGNFIPAAFCGKMLSDCGAEVIKIERPGTGDGCRRFGPFPGDKPDPDTSGLHLYLGAGKKSVTLDLEKPEAQQVLREIAATADVLVEDQPSAYLERRGLGYEALHGLNDRLIYTSVSPFGRTGPYKDYAAYDLQMWHGSAAGHRFFGEPDREPIWGAWYMASHYGAINAAYAILAALFARDLTGRGQFIDISATDTIATLSTGCAWIVLYRQMGLWEKRAGNRQGSGPPSGLYQAGDGGYILVQTTAVQQWDSLVEAMGRPEWALNPAWRGHGNNRVADGEKIFAGVEAWVKAHTAQEVFEACFKHSVPAAPVATARDVYEHPHLQARNYLVDYDHPVAGHVKVPGGLVRGLGERYPDPSPAPLLGQHVREVLTARLGYSDDKVADLKRRGIV